MIPTLSLSALPLLFFLEHESHSFGSLALPLTYLSCESGLMFSQMEGLAFHLLVKAGSVRTLEVRFSEMDRGRAG